MGKRKVGTAKRLHVKLPSPTIAARVSLAKVIGDKLATSALVAANPDLQAQGAKVVATGNDLASTDHGVTLALAATELARSNRRKAEVAHFASVDAFAAMVIAKAVDDKDVESTGLQMATVTTRAVEAPSAVVVDYDPVTRTASLSVLGADHIRTMKFEHCADPLTDASAWQQAEGIGRTRTLAGLPLGRRWFRARSTRGEVDSDYTAPVMVTIR